MKTLSIPVRVVGPGSQPEEETLQYLDIPRDMNTFRMPLVPERVDPEALSEARDMLQEFLEALDSWDPAMGGIGPRIDISGLSPAAIEITDQMLGEGEVSIKDRRHAKGAHPGERVRGHLARVRARCGGSSDRRLDRGRVAARDRARRGASRGGAVAGAGRIARRHDELARAADRDRRSNAPAATRQSGACHQSDVVSADAGGSPRARAGTSRRAGRDHFPRLRELPDQLRRWRETSGASSTSTR